jgi:hypothetical protein
MAQTYSTELDARDDSPAGKALPGLHGGRPRVYRASITMAAQAAGDTIVLAEVPPGLVFSHGIITSSASTATATISIGTSSSAAKYRAAAAVTATDAPALFGIAAAMNDDLLTAEETVIATVGTAALPASGSLVISLVYIGA